MRGRYRVVALHGRGGSFEHIPHPDTRAHAVQLGGTGGRLIGEDWGLDHAAAERLAEELEIAFETGAEQGVEA